MPANLVQQALELSPEARIELIQVLWDSLPQDTADIELTDAQLDELKRRERLLERNGPSGDSWEIVERRLRSRLR